MSVPLHTYIPLSVKAVGTLRAGSAELTACCCSMVLGKLLVARWKWKSCSNTLHCSAGRCSSSSCSALSSQPEKGYRGETVSVWVQEMCVWP